MQENNFEKQVRERLDELHLAPSAPVWQRIEASLKKKRERRLVFWLLPLFLLTGGVALWQATTHFKTGDTQQTAKSKQAPAATFSKPHSTKTGQSTETKIEQQPGQSTPKNAISKTTIRINRKTLERKQSNQPKPDVVKEKRSTQTGNQVAFQKPLTGKTKRPVAVENKTAGVSEGPKKRVAETPAQTGIETKPDTTRQQDTVQQLAPAKNDSAANSGQPPIKVAVPKKRLQWSIVSRIGTTNSVAPVIAGFGMKSMQQADMQPSNSLGSSSYNSGFPWFDSVVYRQPATPTKGLQFTIGARVRKQAGKNNFFTAGLQYSFYSNHLTVGSSLPSNSLTAGIWDMQTERMFRNNGVQNRFTNKLHVVELPLGFEYRLLKQHPLYMQHGVTISQLIASRVLQYNDAANTYSENAAGLRQTNCHVFTSIEYTFWKTKTFSLQAGPHLQYALGTVYKTTPERHLLAGGVLVNMGF